MKSVFLSMESAQQSIVFYDGDCGFCNRSVAWVMKRDQTQQIFFASIQSEFTSDFFTKNKFEMPDLSTFYFYSNGKLYSKSTAGLKVIKHFSVFWRILSFGIVIPRFMRDYVYDAIAKRRQRIFKSYCFIPLEEQKKRFLS